jgi:hypothetical protein
MSGPSFAITVTSLHGRCGKTLLARVIAEYFFLSGEAPYIFDTDIDEHPLRAVFPHIALAVNLALVRHQMALFDTLAKPSTESRIVDLTHRSFRTFFELMRDTDVITEARARRIEPIIFYIPDRKPDSFEAGVWLRERFHDCTFVVVENAFVGMPRADIQHSAAYRSLATNELRLLMPGLTSTLVDALEEPSLSLSDFMRRPLTHDPGRLPDELLEAKALRTWLVALFQGIHRVTGTVIKRTAPLLAARRIVS